MDALKPKYPKAEFARRGNALFEQQVKPHLTAADHGKFIAIDIDSGDYEVDRDDFTATQRLRQRRPEAQTWLCRAGYPTARTMGGHARRTGP